MAPDLLAEVLETRGKWRNVFIILKENDGPSGILCHVKIG